MLRIVRRRERADAVLSATYRRLLAFGLNFPVPLVLVLVLFFILEILAGIILEPRASFSILMSSIGLQIVQKSNPSLIILAVIGCSNGIFIRGSSVNRLPRAEPSFDAGMSDGSAPSSSSSRQMRTFLVPLCGRPRLLRIVVSSPFFQALVFWVDVFLLSGRAT